MKSTAVLLGLGLVTVALTALSCTSGGSRSFPMAERLVLGVEVPDESLSSLARGRAITMTECGACHRLFKPHEFSPARWSVLGEDMGKRSGLSGEQVADLVRYLQAASAHASVARGDAAPRRDAGTTE